MAVGSKISKYHLALAGLCKGRVRDVELIGYVRSDAMARQELNSLLFKKKFA